MSASDREASRQRTAAPMGGEEQEDLPPAKYQDVEGGPVSAAEGREEQLRIENWMKLAPHLREDGK